MGSPSPHRPHGATVSPPGNKPRPRPPSGSSSTQPPNNHTPPPASRRPRLGPALSALACPALAVSAPRPSLLDATAGSRPLPNHLPRPSLPPPSSLVASAQAPPPQEAPPLRPRPRARRPLPASGPRGSPPQSAPLSHPAPTSAPEPRPEPGTTLHSRRRVGAILAVWAVSVPRRRHRAVIPVEPRAPPAVQAPRPRGEPQEPAGRNASQVGRRCAGPSPAGTPAPRPASLPRRLLGFGGFAHLAGADSSPAA